jgi:restriction system protein
MGVHLSIPDYQSFFLPLLLLASDGNVHSVREAIESLSNQFNLSDEERKALLLENLLKSPFPSFPK